ncbi:twin-arginine translocase subunit TatC [bacterium]|nr:MAG: twin-arginine translocase subunit TatC [bacterium]
MRRARTPIRALQVEDPDEFRLTLIEHLEELRDRIIRAIFIIVVAWGIGWFLMPHLYSFLQEHIDKAIKPALPKGSEYREMFTNATQPFLLKFKLSFMIGLIICFPLLVLEVWGFLAPALHPKERAPFKKLAPFSLVLFVMGAGFAWSIIPAALQWFVAYLAEFPNSALFQETGTMVFFVLKMMLAFGAGFQLPLIVYALGLMGLLTAETLVKNWRQAATIIFIASAVFTPSNDAISMLMMAIPLTILFGVSVWAVKVTQSKQAKALLDAERDGLLTED